MTPQARADRVHHLEIASPCTVPWDSMRGDDRVRFCGKCRLDVYSVAGLTRDELRQLIETGQGAVCVRLLRRPDGTVMTRDCGASARRLARRVLTAISIFVAIVLTGTAAGFDSWMTAIRWPRFLDGTEEERPGPADRDTTPVLGRLSLPTESGRTDGLDL